MAEALFQLQNQFAQAIRDPEHVTPPQDIEPRRMRAYQDLFFNNIEGSLGNAFPVVKSLFSQSDWLAMVRDFMIKHRCKTPLFYEVAREFLEYLSNERHQASDPIFLAELAHYEWVELALNVAESAFQVDDTITDSLSFCYRQSPLAWLLSYHYPVHQISIEFQPSAPTEQPLFFLVYRNADNEVKFRELNLVSARLLELLDEGKQAKLAAIEIAEALNHPEPDNVINAANTMIDEWRQQGILLKQPS